jgi:hypothetical protein
MDERETSAMTEGSGLTKDHGGFENLPREMSGKRKQTDLRQRG